MLQGPELQRILSKSRKRVIERRRWRLQKDLEQNRKLHIKLKYLRYLKLVIIHSRYQDTTLNQAQDDLVQNSLLDASFYSSLELLSA